MANALNEGSEAADEEALDSEDDAALEVAEAEVVEAGWSSV